MISAQNYLPLPSFIAWQTLLSLPSFLSHTHRQVFPRVHILHGVILLPRGICLCLEIFGVIIIIGDTGGIQWVEARDAIQYPAHTGQPLQPRIIQSPCRCCQG